jgi:hypothetical protein
LAKMVLAVLAEGRVDQRRSALSARAIQRRPPGRNVTESLSARRPSMTCACDPQPLCSRQLRRLQVKSLMLLVSGGPRRREKGSAGRRTWMGCRAVALHVVLAREALGAALDRAGEALAALGRVAVHVSLEVEDAGEELAHVSSCEV